ncbi:MAG: sensor histidine kinase, partial [Proteobacteria bacterium]|nr:sensor histidine kinase [Pseudomonadota bacterium]
MKKLLLSLLLILMAVSARPVLADNAAKKYVLLLNSYSKGYSWTDNIVKGVEDVLLKQDNIILTIEYMDT